MRSPWSKYPIIKRVDPAAYIAIDATTILAVPQNEGKERLFLGASGYEAWYPTAQHWGQWMFIYTPGGEGLLIRAKDPLCAQQTWALENYNTAGVSARFEIAFWGPNTDLAIEIIDPDPYEALRIYRSWASQQSWFPTDLGRANHLDVMALDPYWGNGGSTTTPFLNAVAGKQRSVWATDWHDANFDTDYPRFVSASGTPALHETYEVTYDAPVFPYFNPVNVDERLTRWPVYNPTYLAVQKRGGSRYFNKQYKARGDPGIGTASYHLMWNCLANQSVQDQIFNQFLSLRTSGGALMRGFYMDVAPGAMPGSNYVGGGVTHPWDETQIKGVSTGGPCWAHNHEHVPGDPYAHQNATRQLLDKIRGLGVLVMGESVSECHLNDLDINLPFGSNGVNDIGETRPFLTYVYGHAKRDSYWQHPYTGEDDATTLASMIDAETTYGHIMHGTPTNQTAWYSLVIDGSHPNTLARLNS